MGDAGCDGFVDTRDALDILVADLFDQQVACSQNADNDCDGDVDPIDTIRILRYEAGLTVIPRPYCKPINEVRPF